MSRPGRLSSYRSNRLRYFRFVLFPKLILIGLILFLSLSASINSVNLTKESIVDDKSDFPHDTLYKSHPKVMMIDSLIKENNLTSAITTYNDLINDHIQLPKGGYLYIGNRFGTSFNTLQQFDSAIFWVDKSMAVENAPHVDTLLVAQQYYIKGVSYNFLNQADSSEKYHRAALKLRQHHSFTTPAELVSSFMGLGNIKRYLIHDYDSASIYYELASKVLKKNEGELSKELFFRCHYNLAATYLRRENRDKAIFFGKEALRNAEDIKSSLYILYAYDLLRNIYVNFHDYLNTEIYARELIKLYEDGNIKENSQLVRNYINVGISQIEKKDYQGALVSLNKALEITLRELPEDNRSLSAIYEEMGVTYQYDGDYEKALKYYHKSLSLKESDAPGAFTTVYKLLGQFHLAHGDRDSAVYYLQQSLHSEAPSFPTNDINYLPRMDSIPHNIKVIVDLIHYKALALTNSASETDKLEKFLLAKSHYLLGDSIITISRSQDLLESEELWMANEIQDYYADAIECLYQLSLFDDQEVDYDLALRFIDQNKAQIMLRSLKESLFLESNGAHDSLVQHNKDINAELAHWKNSQEVQSDPRQRTAIEKKIFELISRKKEIDELIDDTYENFNSLLQTKKLTVDKLSNLSRVDSALILEYYQTENEIYCLSVAGKKIGLDKIITDSVFQKHFNNYNQHLTKANPFVKDKFRVYVESASYLFEKLIPAHLDFRNYHSLTIIPDGILARVPFEALLTSSEGNNTINYRQLPYLIKQMKINYHQNGFSLISQKEAHSYRNGITLAGWAYDQVPGKEKLPMAIKEINDISRDYDNKLFEGSKATKESFLKTSTDYDILHLAIHGNDKSDENHSPCLQFYPDKDNGLLYAYEINKLTLSADMVVLSACKTGSGDIENGEGVFSMARSFFYAGCPSVVLSLWNLKDDAGSEIITSYYKYLKSGLTKDVSMRSAKLNYINGKDDYLSHPSYWAGTILIGNNSPLWSNKSAKVTLLIPLLVMVSVMSLVVFYLSRKRFRHIHK